MRRPFDLILTHLRTSALPIISVDIPSGWDVDSGRQTLETQADEETGEVAVVETFEPEVLISLTAPKKGVRDFKGQHWLGGRFVPEYVPILVWLIASGRRTKRSTRSAQQLT